MLRGEEEPGTTYYNTGNNMGCYKIAWNPITRRGGPISEMAMVVQIAYDIITAIILVKERKV